MKKLFALLFAFTFVFTACGEEKEKMPYERFTFDESVIVREEKDPNFGGASYRINSYDKQGRIVRRTEYLVRDDSINSITDYNFYENGNPHSSRTINAPDRDKPFIMLNFADEERTHNSFYAYGYEKSTDTYTFSMHTETDIVKIPIPPERTVFENGEKIDRWYLASLSTEYDENGNELWRYRFVYNDDAKPVFREVYENGEKTEEVYRITGSNTEITVFFEDGAVTGRTVHHKDRLGNPGYTEYYDEFGQLIKTIPDEVAAVE